MDESTTDSLRKLAPSWTLAGDEQLLNILQSTHQKLLSRCQEANSQLEKMASALNDASISLQNVNNQFMSLSSSQFIESRVYDDDDLTTEPPAPKESPQQEVEDELSCLKRSLSVLEQSHEIITILQDSDTESDTDDEVPARMVLKPRDMYWERPLPYIIGSQPWKNKWHAGLVVEGTDSESSVSERGEDSDQYSHSETEGTRPHTHTLRTQVSETSSSLPSEQGSIPRPTPSDVASDIARRLGAALPNKMVEREPSPEEPPQPASRKVYRPQDPVSSTIFPDEPPPLSEHSDSQDSDIFAEIHRQAGGTGGTGADSRPDGLRGDGDLFSGIGYQPPTKPPQATVPAPQRTSHRDHHDDYDDDDDDQTAYNQQGHDMKQTADADVDRGVKKPVGGISLFGNKGTESIGAAILKRNQRKTSTSGDDSDTDIQPQQQIKKEKDIFDDLFARSEGRKVVKDKTDLVKDLKDKVQKKDKEKDKNIEKNEKTKVDLFSDDLFDDIDDIFSSNVTKIPTKDNKTTKPIFDDDDDLFSEIAPPKPTRIEVATSSNVKKSLFDSDDDLFADNLQAKPDDKPKAKEVEINKAVEPSRVNKEVTRSIFDDDDDDLFNDLKTTKGNDDLKVQSVNIGKADGGQSKKINENTSTVFKSPSLFDDDDDDDGDLFAKAVTSSIKVNKTSSDLNDDVTDVKPSSSSVKTDDLNTVTNDNVIKVNNNNNTDDKIENKNKDLNENVSVDSKNEILVNKNVGDNAAKIFTHIQRERSSSESNNDFSDQDFDDLPPKPATSNILPDDNKPKPIEKENIFDKTTLEEDIDELFTKAQQNQNTEEIFDEPPPITEIIPEKTEKDNKKATETDIFNDILTEPPIFEKPKEPKRSKNVNALFDDDSDDESLFFKKNDHVFDDHPNDFTPTQDRIFGLFADEPPDDGFGKASDADDDLFATEPKPKVPSNNNLPPLPVHEILTENDDKQTELVNEEDIFKVAHVEILKDTKIGDDQRRDDVLDKPKSAFPLSVDDNDDDDDGLFKIPEIPKSSLKEKPHLDMSDDENLFSKPEIKPAVVEPTPVLVTEKVQLPKPVDDELFTPEKHEKLKIESKTNIEIDSKSDEELFKVPENKPIPEKVIDLSKTSDDELFSPVKTVTKAENSKLDEDIFKIKAKPEIVNKAENTQEVKSPESKKVGKLKVGLNINVNALLPGASPKKVKPSQDQSDGLVQSVDQSQRSEVKILPELPKPQIESQKDVSKPKSDQNPDSTLIKSVSFDGKPESEVLDNKISKERAKIQVKRRPSTRRARREAVRKSAIDFGEDSTDNSSSIDDVPKILPGNQPENTQDGKLDKNVEPAEIKTTILKDNEAKITQDGNVDKKLEQAEVNTEKTIIQSKDTPEISDNIAEKQPFVQDKRIEITEKPTQSIEKPASSIDTIQNIDKPTFSKDVKSKVVYILNDEDIFNTSPVQSSQKTENLDPKPGVTTLGKVYKEIDKNIDKKIDGKSLFGEEDDDEIFKSKVPVKKNTIFDSDSEEDLFGDGKQKKKEIVEVKKEIKREVVKGSLFGDDDDDDDLFGVKTKKAVERNPQPARPTSTKEPAKPSEPVFADPLSMFGDDD
ncbi:WASH complex subunit 2A [Spodoptera frugiperda]|uniref:WASH complex subunit 2A n=1 Tax=Spodoptera frugiperda TaxID=7108 RepID=A0A9R0E3N1_SPOFR|nr:WASH complex subunit 2A [Spodoptera frugiperda]